MSDKPQPCHHDPTTGQRMLLEHRRDCRARGCGGCVPCEEPHCGLCNRNHLDGFHPLTCPKCVGSVREDLAVVEVLYGWLQDQAQNAGDDGRLVAAAPIPGGVAQVLQGPYTPLGDAIVTRTSRTKDHLASDPVPPLAVLAGWEDLWRAWLRQAPDPVGVYDHDQTKLVVRRAAATVEGARAYLDQHLTMMAQIARLAVTPQGTIEVPPDFVAFASDMADLRTQLDRVLHDERGPDRGIGCFECGAPLVRRHRYPAPCVCGPRVTTHDVHGPCTCVPWDPGHIHPAIGPECRACGWERRHAEHSQGGLDDARPGFGWECRQCRRRYTPAEYVYAVRRDLVDSQEASCWTDMATAAEAAGAMLDTVLPVTTVRVWASRGLVGVGCSWKPGRPYGARVVAWLDVAEQATRRKLPRGKSKGGAA